MNCIRIFQATLFAMSMTIATASCEYQFTRQSEDEHITKTPSRSMETTVPQFATASKILTSIPISSPTFSLVQVEQEIRRLYFDNDGCELPCFWGITPGKTTGQEVSARFSMLGTVSDEDYRWKDKFKLRSITVSSPPEIDSFNEKEWSFHIVVSNEIVNSIIANSRHLKQTSIPTMSNMLAIFGNPEEIWIGITPIFPEQKSTAYDIALFYPSKGILIMGSGNADIVYENEQSAKFSICPQLIDKTIDMNRHYPFALHLWSPENKMSFGDLSYGTKVFEHRLFSLLESSKGSINTNEFYKTYIDPAVTQCFEWTLTLGPP